MTCIHNSPHLLQLSRYVFAIRKRAKAPKMIRKMAIKLTVASSKKIEFIRFLPHSLFSIKKISKIYTKIKMDPFKANFLK